MAIWDEIKTQFQGEILTDWDTRHAYSRDASIFEMTPACVARPKNVQDLKTLVNWVAKNKSRHPELSITARAAGTDMSGGAINDSIIADMAAHFGRIEMFGPDYAVVRPGVFYHDFEAESLKRNLLLPCHPASKALTTLGGMAANNSGGGKSFIYGQAKDYIEEIRAVLADGNEYVFGELDNSQLEQKLRLPGFEGELYRGVFRLLRDNYELLQKAKPKTLGNASGYLLWEVWNKNTFNLAKLFAGSQGTLGIITKIKYRLVRPKAFSELAVIKLNSLARLGEAVACLRSYHPESLEGFDRQVLKAVLRFLPALTKKMEGSRLKNWHAFVPEIFKRLTGTLPKMVLLAEFAGNNHKEVLQKMVLLEKELYSKFRFKAKFATSKREMQKYAILRQENLNLLRQRGKKEFAASFIDDLIVPPSATEDFLPRLEAILGQYPKLKYAMTGQLGDGNFHILPQVDFSNPKHRAVLPHLAEKIYDLVLQFGGSLSAQHNDGLIRTPFLEKMYGHEIIKLFAETKRIFDPQNIFNPGKKTGHSLAESLGRVKRSA